MRQLPRSKESGNPAPHRRQGNTWTTEMSARMAALLICGADARYSPQTVEAMEERKANELPLDVSGRVLSEARQPLNLPTR